MSSAEIKVYADLPSLSLAASEMIDALAQEAVARRKAFLLALSGGSTPAALYALLGQRWGARSDLLPYIHFFWSDERCVAPNDRRSNYALANKALLAGLALPQGNVHRIKGELGLPVAVADYEEELNSLGIRLDGEILFDCILLGLGSDGHTASLFPGRPSLLVKKSLLTGEDSPALEPKVARVTMTLPALCLARKLVFLAAGADKAAPLGAGLSPQAMADPARPLTLLGPAAQRSVFFLDAPAASLLNR